MDKSRFTYFSALSKEGKESVWGKIGEILPGGEREIAE
jgi:hypothetical protein